MNIEYHSKAHSKFLLIFHLILVCKYRKKLLSDASISRKIKELTEEYYDEDDEFLIKKFKRGTAPQKMAAAKVLKERGYDLKELRS